MLRALAAALLCLIVCSGCDKSDPAGPNSPDAGERVTGTERFGWQQFAADTTELAGIRYALYVDGVRRELVDARCDEPATASGFTCSAPLPGLANGAHVLELASFIVDGGNVLEGARSAALGIVVGRASLSTAVVSETFTTGDGVALRLYPLADDLEDAVDLTFAPDGRAFIGQADGTVRIVTAATAAPQRPGSLAGGPDDRLLALALDPAFADTHYLFALLTTADASGAPTFLLARFREQEGAIGERIVLIDDVPTAADPSGSLRFGPDGKLYVTLDDGGTPERARDLASRNGKVLRLNADGSTPDDQASLTPVFASGFRVPHALSWQPVTGRPWLADESPAGEPLLYALDRHAPGSRSRVRAAFRLPPATMPSSTLFYRQRVIPAFENNLFVTAESEPQLLRFTFDSGDPLKMVSTERLLPSGIGPLRTVTQTPDGSLHVLTDRLLLRIDPALP